MKPQSFYFEIPIFRHDLYISVADTVQEAIDAVSASNGPFPARDNNKRDNVEACVRTEFDMNLVLIAVTPSIDVDGITHESVHATGGILQNIGDQADHKNDEVFAYLAGWISGKVAECLSAVNKQKAEERKIHIPDPTSCSACDLTRHFFVFDVESIGLYGVPFAVAGGVLVKGEDKLRDEFLFSMEIPEHKEDDVDATQIKWLLENVPELPITHKGDIYSGNVYPSFYKDFWVMWVKAQEKYPGIVMAADCIFPVETGFLSRAVAEASCRSEADKSPLYNISQEEMMKNSPYPVLDITSIMFAAGIDPMKEYERLSDEQPKHHPLKDARQSARLLNEALGKLRGDHVE